MEKDRSGYHPEQGPGGSNRKMERRGERLVMGSEGLVRVPVRLVRGPGRYSGRFPVVQFKSA